MADRYAWDKANVNENWELDLKSREEYMTLGSSKDVVYVAASYAIDASGMISLVDPVQVSSKKSVVDYPYAMINETSGETLYSSAVQESYWTRQGLLSDTGDGLIWVLYVGTSTSDMTDIIKYTSTLKQSAGTSITTVTDADPQKYPNNGVGGG